MKTIKPPQIKKGDSIGIFALSIPASLDQAKIERAYNFLRALGFNIIEAKNLYDKKGHAAGNVADRVKAFHELYKNKKVKMLLSFWGGMNTHQVLESLDYDYIKKHPKIIMGYNDTTSLLVAIHKMTGLICFNGPAVITFVKPELPLVTSEVFLDIFLTNKKEILLSDSEKFSDNKWYINNQMKWTTNPGRKVHRSGKASGQIIGGNMGTMLLLAGTKYWPSFKNKILVIEEDESESTQSIDRFFTQLRQMGVFKEITGLVIGRFARCVGFKDTDSLDMILNEALRGYKFPVITEVDFGHTDPLWTIPLGAKMCLDTKKKVIKILGPVLSLS